MSDTAKPEAVQQKSGLRIPGFAQLQRLGKSLMLPIAVLPAAGILLRLGQPDLLGSIKAPVIGPFFQAMSAAGDARVHQPTSAVRRRRRDRIRQEGRRFDRTGGRRGLPGGAGGVQDHVADRARRRGRQGWRPGPDQLQRVRGNRGRSAHRVAVRPLPHHPIAVVPRILRRQALRPDRGVSGLPVPRVRDELLLSDLRCRADRPRQVHRRLGRARRLRLRVRQPHADSARPAPHPELVHLVPLRRLSTARRRKGRHR